MKNKNPQLYNEKGMPLIYAEAFEKLTKEEVLAYLSWKLFYDHKDYNEGDIPKWVTESYLKTCKKMLEGKEEDAWMYVAGYYYKKFIEIKNERY